MKYAVTVGSSAIIYVLSFIKIGSDFQELTRGYTYGQHRQHGDRISML
jgi:hypothetical protein